MLNSRHLSVGAVPHGGKYLSLRSLCFEIEYWLQLPGNTTDQLLFLDFELGFNMFVSQRLERSQADTHSILLVTSPPRAMWQPDQQT
jgi:hypothetical protein